MATAPIKIGWGTTNQVDSAFSERLLTSLYGPGGTVVTVMVDL